MKRLGAANRRRAYAGIALALSLPPLAGCTIVSIADDRAARERRSGAFDADRYVAHMWAATIVPTLNDRAVPYAKLSAATAAALPQAGQAMGRQVGEGAAWTFVTAVDGRVIAIDRASRQGILTIQPDGGAPVAVQIGPVVTGTALRDAVPSLNFDDFTDQIAFAEVGEAITHRAIAAVDPVIARMKPGERVRVLGAFNLRHAGDPVLLTPLTVTGVGA
jgi:predicted lipoprotein